MVIFHSYVSLPEGSYEGPGCPPTPNNIPSRIDVQVAELFSDFLHVSLGCPETASPTLWKNLIKPPGLAKLLDKPNPNGMIS
jgi:hypothetical protein